MASYTIFLKHQHLCFFCKMMPLGPGSVQFGNMQQVWEGHPSSRATVSHFFPFILKARWVLLSICHTLSPHKHLLCVKHPPTKEIKVNLAWLSHSSTFPSTRNLNAQNIQEPIREPAELRVILPRESQNCHISLTLPNSSPSDCSHLVDIF